MTYVDDDGDEFDETDRDRADYADDDMPCRDCKEPARLGHAADCIVAALDLAADHAERLAQELEASRAEVVRVRALAGQACELAHRLALHLEATGTTKADRTAWGVEGRQEADQISVAANLGSPHRWHAVVIHYLTDRARAAPLDSVAVRAIEAHLEREGLIDDVRVEIDAGSPPAAIAPRDLETDDDVLRMAAEMVAAGGSP